MTRKEKKKFNKELADFVTTALILGFINFMTSPGYLWFLWVIGFWGAALVGKYIQYVMDGELEDDEDYLELDDHPQNEKEKQKWREKDMV